MRVSRPADGRQRLPQLETCRRISISSRPGARRQVSRVQTQTRILDRTTSRNHDRTACRTILRRIRKREAIRIGDQRHGQAIRAQLRVTKAATAMADGRNLVRCQRAQLPNRTERVNPRVVAENSVVRTARTVARDRKVGAMVQKVVVQKVGAMVRRDVDTAAVTRVLH